ncbi:MAG: pyridoxal phosphate-dependent aminotransferase [Rhodospirillales bacterium]
MSASVRALGTESAFTVLARAQALAADGRDIINLGIGQPDFPPPPHVVEAAIKALRDGHHGYTAANGILELREAVVRDLKRRRGVTIDPGRVLIVPGGKTTMFFAITMFAEPGVEILYPDPGFPIYGNLIKYGGATGIALAGSGAPRFSLDADAVLAQITERTRLIILNSPSNPTGNVIPAGEMRRLIEGLRRHPGVHVLSDEIYARMIYDGAGHVSAFDDDELRQRVILLDGWSKTYAMTGWRLGYGVWPEELVEPATRLAINSHSCVNAAAQFAGIAALDGPQDHTGKMISAFERRRQLTVDGLNTLPGVTCPMPGGAFYTFPDVTDTGLSATGFQDAMLDDAGVATIAGTSFGDGGGGHVRVSYANSSDNIERAIGRMAERLKKV